MFTRFSKSLQGAAARKALEALDGLGINLLTNTPTDTFWYAQDSLETRYAQEYAKVGDHFWDGNNGDRHTVVAVDLENSRIAVRNEDQNSDLVYIVVW